MRISTSLLAALAAASGIAAQGTASNNEHANYRTSISFTSRHFIAGTSDGWVGNRSSREWMRGAGQVVDDTTGQLVNRAVSQYWILQDQDRTTQEIYGCGIFNSKAASPDEPSFPDAADALPAEGGIFGGSFTSPAAAGTGAAAWGITITYGTPYDAIPDAADFWMGVKLPANALWVQDGLSVQGCWMTAGNNGDYPSAGAIQAGLPTLVQTNDLTADPTGQANNAPSNDRTCVHRFNGPGASMRLGAAVDTNAIGARGPANNYGFGGIYPDHSTRRDGLAFKIEDQNTAGLPLVVIGVVGSLPDASGNVFNPAGLPLPIDGNNGPINAGLFYPSFGSLQTYDWLFGAGVGNNTGVFDAAVFSFGVLPATPLGRISFQGVVFGQDASGNDFVKFTNSMAFTSL